MKWNWMVFWHWHILDSIIHWKWFVFYLTVVELWLNEKREKDWKVLQKGLFERFLSLKSEKSYHFIMKIMFNYYWLQYRWRKYQSNKCSYRPTSQFFPSHCFEKFDSKWLILHNFFNKNHYFEVNTEKKGNLCGWVKVPLQHCKQIVKFITSRCDQSTSILD